MKRDPHCHYCGCEVVYYDNHGGRLPPNFATIDHVYSRLTPGGRPIKGDTVLACKKCNEERGIAEVAQLPKAELWARSGRAPSGVAS
jgi:HNH endonuclease